MTTLHAVGNWAYWFFGFSGTGSHYAAWSGALSDVGEVTLAGAVVMGWRHVNCHAKGCWRIGRHDLPTLAGTFKVCHRHHPHEDITGRSIPAAVLHRLHADLRRAA